MKKYDLHMHTTFSVDSTNKPAMLLKLAKKRGIGGIAVTDHNTWKGSQVVKKLNTDKEFEVISANEIRTQYGDVLVYYLQEEIKTRDLFELLDEVKQQDALVSIAHPFRMMESMNFGYDIRKIAKSIHAVEGFNGRTLRGGNVKAQAIAKQCNLALTAGSDAHFPIEVGRTYVTFEGDLRTAIKKKATKVQGTNRYLPYARMIGIPRFFWRKLTSSR